MGRNRKPKAVHELNGTFEKHPERAAAYANEPKPEGPLGPPPASFDPASFTGSRLLAIWEELVAQAPPGVLTSADRLHVELACRLMFRIRQGGAKSGDYSRLESLLGKMGMNPADRSKVNITPTATPQSRANAESSNTFAQIAAEVGQQRAVN
jgi:hypothetical protein